MKTLLLILSIVFLFSCKLYSDTFIKTTDGQSNETEINLISSDNIKTVIEVKVNGFYNKKVDVSGTVYDNIYLKDFVSLGESGQAALPTITKIIAIPNYKNVNIVINESEYQTFKSYNVIPYQTPPLRSEILYTFEKDNSYYSNNKNYPDAIVSIKEIAIIRDYRVAVVTINPILYNPALGELKVYTDIKFELKYEGYSEVNNLFNVIATRSGQFENLYKKVIFNYKEEDNLFTEPPNMLIVIADSLYNSILPYAEWKTKKGIKTVIKKRSEIGIGGADPTAQQLKDYFIAQYNSPERPEFVLLVGDARGRNILPWFNAIGGKSDHPYSCVSGTDILPDIVVGRFSVQTTAELDSAVIKSIQYEKQPNMIQTDWYRRAIVLHSNDGIDPINGQLAKRVFLDEGGFTNVDLVNNSFSQSQITTLLNGGVSWVWFIGHGSETSWADPVWNMSNMVNLNFGQRQPNIVSIACSNADLDYSLTADCFGEAWIDRSPGNSATNIAASTELCAFYTTDTIGREMLYAYFRHGIYDFGSMLNFGKIQAYNYFNGNGTVIETINQFMVIGDPSIESYSDVPKTVNVISNLGGLNYNINVKVNGQNIKGALVAINQNQILKISGYTDSTGNYSFSSTYVEHGIPVNLVVTGKNLHPYDGNLTLTSVNYISEIPQSFSLNQNYPNPFNPSTKIQFSIAENSFVSLKVYDILGKEVTALVNENLNAGIYNLDFNAVNLTSGIYFYKMTAGDHTDIKKMTLLK